LTPRHHLSNEKKRRFVTEMQVINDPDGRGSIHDSGRYLEQSVKDSFSLSLVLFLLLALPSES